MKRALIALVFAFVALLATDSLGLAQTSPQFRASFKALADMIPNVVGAPTENEYWDPNGNVVQHTSTGMMVWRASDRWTAFTNGNITWIMGPYGLQSRSNSDLYPWEVVPPGPTPAHQQTSPTTDQYNPYELPPIPTAPPTPVPAAATPVPPQPTATPAPASGPAPTYVPDVRAMDDESGGHGVTIKAYMQQMDGLWLAVWGWRPHKPTTIYLYNDGYRMMYGISQITGQYFNQWDVDSTAANIAASLGSDRTNGGYAIFLNLAYQYGSDNWLDALKANLLQQYGNVMIQDMANNAGPDWFRIGMSQWMAYSNVTRTPAELGVTHYASLAKSRGTLPSLYTL
ncbi:MAG TPA: hypothetical protein VHS28_04380, partial [Chloroflexota bacterium]|nr:hypothetical protein [Chloroflexota bacterium]